jgi:hypothetical protein
MTSCMVTMRTYGCQSPSAGLPDRYIIQALLLWRMHPLEE